jgi:hypothetical protein
MHEDARAQTPGSPACYNGGLTLLQAPDDETQPLLLPQAYFC